MGSGSRESIVASDHRNGSDPLFSQPKNSILNIKMMSTVFDVIHGWMPFIEENTNRMTFRGNARIFSTNFFWTTISGRREYCLTRGVLLRREIRPSRRRWKSVGLGGAPGVRVEDNNRTVPCNCNAQPQGVLFSCCILYTLPYQIAPHYSVRALE